MPWTLWSWWSLIMSNLIKKSSSCTSDVTIPLWSVKRFANSTFGLSFFFLKLASFVNVFASRLRKSSNFTYCFWRRQTSHSQSLRNIQSPGIQALPNHEPMAWMKQPRFSTEITGEAKFKAEVRQRRYLDYWRCVKKLKKSCIYTGVLSIEESVF